MTALFDTCMMLFFDRNCSSISPIQWCIRRFVVRHPHPSACSSFAKLAAYLIVLSTSLPLPLNCCTRSFPCVCVCVYERVHESLHILIPYEIKKGVSPLLPFFSYRLWKNSANAVVWNPQFIQPFQWILSTVQLVERSNFMSVR